MVHAEPGHTDSDSLIYFPQSKVVHMGDVFVNGRFPFVDLGSGGRVEGIARTVARVLEEYPADVKIIPGHGALATPRRPRALPAHAEGDHPDGEGRNRVGQVARRDPACGAVGGVEGLGDRPFRTQDVWIESVYQSLRAGASAVDPLCVLLRSLDLAPAAAATTPSIGDPGGERGALFGGLVAAMSVAALARTVDPARRLHSLHAYFLRFGRHGTPIRFAVDRVRDGGSYSTRRVEASQEDAAIFVATASFCLPEEGISHQDDPPEAPPPDGLADRDETARAHRRPAQPQQRGRGADVRSAIRSAPPSRGRPASGCGSARAVRCPTIRWCTRRCSPTSATPRSCRPSTCATRCGGASARRRASTTRSGSTGRRATTTGSSTTSASPAAHAGRGLLLGAIYDAGGAAHRERGAGSDDAPQTNVMPRRLDRVLPGPPRRRRRAALLRSDWLAPDRVLLVRDVPMFHLPLRLVSSALARHGWPLWNPMINGGQPILSNPNYAAFYPPTWLALVVPPHYAMSLIVLLHARWAFAGAWRLARALGCRTVVRAFAAIAFVASSAFVATINNFTLFCGLAWLPWVLHWGMLGLHGADRARERARHRSLGRRAWRADPLGRALLAHARRAGAGVSRRSGGEAAWRAKIAPTRRDGRRWRRVSGRRSWCRRCGTSRTRRDPDRSPIEQTMTWSTRPDRFIEWVFPNLRGDPVASRSRPLLRSGPPRPRFRLPSLDLRRSARSRSGRCRVCSAAALRTAPPGPR